MTVLAVVIGTQQKGNFLTETILRALRVVVFEVLLKLLKNIIFLFFSNGTSIHYIPISCHILMLVNWIALDL